MGLLQCPAEHLRVGMVVGWSEVIVVGWSEVIAVGCSRVVGRNGTHHCRDVQNPRERLDRE